MKRAPVHQKGKRAPIERRLEKRITLGKGVRAKVNKIASTKAGASSWTARFDRRNRKIKRPRRGPAIGAHPSQPRRSARYSGRVEHTRDLNERRESADRQEQRAPCNSLHDRVFTDVFGVAYVLHFRLSFPIVPRHPKPVADRNCP